MFRIVKHNPTNTHTNKHDIQQCHINASNRVVSKGPLYPSKIEVIVFVWLLIRPCVYASDKKKNNNNNKDNNNNDNNVYIYIYIYIDI